MDPTRYRWTVQYGERARGDTGRYALVKQGEPRLQFDSKPDAIAEAQRLNGWQVDGNERNYTSQAAQADQRRRHSSE